jgi:signal transduction histidine kinase
VLEERGRLAREMHDTLIQGCIGVSALLEAASTAQSVSQAVGHQLLDRARDEIRSTVDEARMAVWNLRNPGDPAADLPVTLDRLAQRVSNESGIPIRVTYSGDAIPMAGEASRNLTLLVREALQNAVRHAAANLVVVHLNFNGTCLEVVVEDDGRGFDPTAEQRANGHYGLIGMRERVERLGGDFHLTSTPGKGTQVRLQIPIKI